MATRADLKKRIARVLNYQGFTDDELNTICEYVVTRLNQELRISDMLTRVTVTVAGRNVDLPPDFLAMRTLRITSGDFGAVSNPLVYAPPEELVALSGLWPQQYPGYYCNYGEEMELVPYRTGSTFNLDMWYYGKIPQFTADTDTNLALQKYPNLCLNLGCIYGSQFMLEPEDVSMRESLVQAEFGRIAQNRDNERYGDGPIITRPTVRLGGRFS